MQWKLPHAYLATCSLCNDKRTAANSNTLPADKVAAAFLLIMPLLDDVLYLYIALDYAASYGFHGLVRVKVTLPAQQQMHSSKWPALPASPDFAGPPKHW